MGLANGHYMLVFETSFNLGFATNLGVVFEPCHKDNVVVVTKIVSYLYLYLYYICMFVSKYVNLLFENKIIFYFVNQT